MALPWESFRWGGAGFAQASSFGRDNDYTTGIRFWMQSELGSAHWSEIDLEANPYCNFKLSIDYSHPNTLTFEALAAQQTTPLPYRIGVVFTDDAYGGIETPLFEGYVQQIQPKESLKLEYTCYGFDRKTTDEVPVMSGSWMDGSPPSEGTGTIPRLVYNAKIDSDEDAAVQRRDDANIETILTDIFSDATPILRSLNCAPPATSAYGSAPYVPAELTGLTFKPQEKIVFESLGLRAAVDQMIHWYPGRRIWIEPGSQRRWWHFYSVLSSPQLTLTLNQFAEGGRWVLKLDVTRSLENRYTAVKIYGPPNPVIANVEKRAGGLTEVWTEPQASAALAYTGAPPHPEDAAFGNAYRKWQITEATRRRMTRLLPSQQLVQVGQFLGGGLAWRFTREPTLQVQWSAGGDWEPVNGAYFDLNNGIVNIRHRLLRSVQVNGSTWSYSAPYDVRLLYAYLDAPLAVRYPTSGYSGSAYTAANLTVEHKIYDESLAIGYENGIPVTSAARTAEYVKIAQTIQEAHRDIVFAGGATLQGLDYEFARLNRRVNIAAVDGSGNIITTGWEAIAAPVTGVEYDFAERLTTITLSGDHLEYLYGDIDRLKTFLKIDTKLFHRTPLPFVSDVISRTGQFAQQARFTYGVSEMNAKEITDAYAKLSAEKNTKPFTKG